MNETEWLSCNDPPPMLKFLRGKGSERKLRLFGVACCRRIWHLLTDERSRQAIEVAERYAEGNVLPSTLHVAQTAAWNAHRKMERTFSNGELRTTADSKDSRLFASEAAVWVAWRQPKAVWRRVDDNERNAGQTAWAVTEAVAGQVVTASSQESPWQELQAREATARQSEKRTHSRLLRDIFGNPGHPVAFDSSWLTMTVIQLAEAIYTERSFDRLPILADALEEAGCTNADMLNHCRQPGDHARGCWVVDCILGKE